MPKKLSDIDLRELLLIILYKMKKYKVGKIDGRTKIQKIMFILKNEFSLPQNFNYFLYTHGPYSALLQNGIDALATFDLMEEKTSYLYDYLRYEYHLTPRGEKVAKSIAKTLDQSTVKTLERITKKVIELNERNLSNLVDEAYEYVNKGAL